MAIISNTNANKRLYDAVTYIDNAATLLEIVTRQIPNQIDTYSAFRTLKKAIKQCNDAIKNIESKPVRRLMLRMRP